MSVSRYALENNEIDIGPAGTVTVIVEKSQTFEIQTATFFKRNVILIVKIHKRRWNGSFAAKTGVTKQKVTKHQKDVAHIIKLQIIIYYAQCYRA